MFLEDSSNHLIKIKNAERHSTRLYGKQLSTKLRKTFFEESKIDDYTICNSSETKVNFK